MLNPTSTVAAALAALLAIACLATAATAAPTSQRPGGGTYGRCIDDSLSGGSDWECGGAICSCCYTDGCFICENNPGAPSDQSDCHWEPPYHVGGRTGSSVGQPGSLLDSGPADPPSSQRPLVTPEGRISQ
ncbi:MAG: hypothetical protein ACFCVH_14415 [Alphaproteobacteria bacterium]